MPRLDVSIISLESLNLASFSTGILSPVKTDVLINKSLESKIIESAGIIEPALSSTII